MSVEQENSKIVQLMAEVEALQSRLEFQAHTIESLDGVVVEQEKRLSKQERQLQLLANRFKSVESRVSQSEAPAEDERPPHY